METPKVVRELKPDDRDQTGADGEFDAARKPPPIRPDDDAPAFGDADQHSDADA